MSREAFFYRAEFLIHYVKSKAPLPSWMKEIPTVKEQPAEELSEVQEIAQNITAGLILKNIDPESPIGREHFSKIMGKVLEDYNWLN